jgi:copper chaperone CopZ
VKSVTFQIEGMHCDGCAATIKALVEREAGVKAAFVVFKTGEARILYDPAATSEGRLVTAIGRLGFRVAGRGP